MKRAVLSPVSTVVATSNTDYRLERTLSIEDGPVIHLEVGNQDQWESDDKTAQQAVELLAGMGYTVVVPEGQVPTSTFTPEERAVLNGWFHIKQTEIKEIEWES